MPTPIRGGGIIRITLNIVPQSYPTIYFRHSQHNPSITVLSQSVDIHRPSYELEHRQKSIFFLSRQTTAIQPFVLTGPISSTTWMSWYSNVRPSWTSLAVRDDTSVGYQLSVFYRSDALPHIDHRSVSRHLKAECLQVP